MTIPFKIKERDGEPFVIRLFAAEEIARAVAAAADAEQSVVSAQALTNFRSTLADGVADFAVGEYFSSAETGELRLYERTASSPFYVDMGDAVAPLSKALLSSATGAGEVGFSQPGAAVTRTVEDELREVSTPTQHGALADGSADATGAFEEAGASSDAVTVREGRYRLNSAPAVSVPIISRTGVLYRDADTTQYYPSLYQRGVSLSAGGRETEQRSFGSWAPTIVCYGDSNTRYYDGETGAGPYAYSYGAYLDIECARYPWLFGATVSIRGYPSQTIQYGIDNFAANVVSGDDVVVIGFGTNDIKLSGASLETYIGKMAQLIDLCLANDSTPIVLAIPWFADDYGDDGALSQARIPVWNARLEGLCREYGIAFIDDYNAFKEATGTFFNDTPARHLSPAAQRFRARRVVDALLGPSKLGAFKYEAALFRNSFTLPELGELKAGAFTRAHYQNAVHMEALVIAAGKSIVLSGAGRWCIGFYPRANATAQITDPTGTTNVTITDDIDAGLYYPIIRASGTGALLDDPTYDLTITASGGSLYPICWAFDETPIMLTNGARVETNVAGLPTPADAVSGREYYVSELLHGVRSISNGWVGPHGYRSIGTTSQRDALTLKATGQKFYNTTAGALQTWNGTAWV